MSAPSHFPLRVPVDVRFRDLDALGHVNNAVYLTYLEVARLALFRALDLARDERVPVVVARVEIDYRRPVLLGDRVDVLVWVRAVGTKSFTLAYEARVRDEVVAEASSVQVWLDSSSGAPAPVPAAARAALEFATIE